MQEAKTYDVYVIMRARIALRKKGLIPVEDKAIENDIIRNEMTAIKACRGKPVSTEEIIAAFHKGDEVSAVFLFLSCAQNQQKQSL